MNRAKILVIIIGLFILGVGLAGFVEVETLYLGFLLTLLFLVSFLFSKNINMLIIVLSLISFIFGLVIYKYQEEKYIDLNSRYKNQEIKSEVTVVDIPFMGEHGQIAKIKYQNTIFTAYFRSFPSISYGEIIRIQGKIKQYPEGKRNQLIKNRVSGEINISDYEIVGKSEEVLIKLKGSLYFFRNKINESLFTSLPKEESGLASGLILGEKALISEKLKRALQSTGTTHIIALSGYNITIILGLISFLKSKYSRLMNLLIPSLFLFFFIVMTGASASIVRAGIMGMMPLVARFLGRPNNTFISILFSAFLMIIINPFILLYDPSFQLSFMAMIGIIYLTPKLVKIVKNDILAETLGAQLFVLPLVVYYFGVVSIISPFANLVILLFVPFAMLAAFLIGSIGIFSIAISRFLAIPAYYLFKTINSLIVYFGGLPFASFQLKIEIWHMFVYYLILIDLLFLFSKKKKYLERV